MAEYNPSKIIKDGNTYNFRDTTKIPLAGSSQISGDLIPSTDNAYDFGDSSHNFKIVYAKEIRHGLSSKALVLSGGDGVSNGANLILYGTNRSDGFQGRFDLAAKGSSDYKLTGKSNGTLTWGSKNVAMQEDVIPRSGGAVMTGINLLRTVSDSSFVVGGGSAWENGARLVLRGKDNTTEPGFAYITANDGTRTNGFQIRPNGDTLLVDCLVLYPNVDNTVDLGTPAYRWKAIYSATGTINTSDSRLKNSVKDIDDKLLDAWENIEPKQYKFNDATEKKGEKARYHTGYLAQDIQTECEKQGVNASDYGLFCYDEWDEQEEVSEEIETERDGKKVKEKRIVQPKREKGNMYALRYTEALIVECAYLRKKLKELTARIEQLEKGNNVK